MIRSRTGRPFGAELLERQLSEDRCSYLRCLKCGNLLDLKFPVAQDRSYADLVSAGCVVSHAGNALYGRKRIPKSAGRFIDRHRSIPCQLSLSMECDDSSTTKALLALIALMISGRPTLRRICGVLIYPDEHTLALQVLGELLRIRRILAEILAENVSKMRRLFEGSRMATWGECANLGREADDYF